MNFPAHLINTPCIIQGTDLPAGRYDANGNCIIKVPFALTRPDGTVSIPYNLLRLREPDGTCRSPEGCMTQTDSDRIRDANRP